jgi:hypothetical protein
MRTLSLSRAWEETRDILTRDGRLFVSVALALVVLPAVISGLVNPKGMGSTSVPFWASLVGLAASLVMLAGQLGLVRLALAPSITVGGAIAHGVRRMPIYFVGALLVVLALFVLAIPFGLVAAAMGVPLDRTGGSVPASPPFVILAVVYLLLAVFIGVRMLMAAPVASAEPVGPIALLRRSWALTNGHFWELVGFLLLFFIAAMIVLVGVGTAVGVVVRLAFGSLEPLSVGALIVALVQAVLSAAFTTFLAIMLARIYVQLSGNSDQAAEVFR